MRKTLIIISLISLYSCATIGTLGGGKVDDQAPKLINTNIKKTNFISRKIIFEFDEYITLNNPDKNISLQPSHSTFKSIINNKTLTITFDSLLQANTTYNLLIDKGITDNNAGNPFYYSTIFSTGNIIDTGKIVVTIKRYKDLKKLKISLSKNQNTHDSFKNFKSDYIFEVNKDNIIFDGISKTIDYNLWLFTDENDDKKPDWYKPINFIENINTDSTYELEPIPWKQPFIIIKTIADLRTLKLYYTSTNKAETNILDILANSNDSFYYINSDSALLKYNIATHRTTLIPLDTVTYINYKLETNKYLKQSIKIIKLKNQFRIKLIQPAYYLPSGELDKEVIIYTNQADSLLFFPYGNLSLTPDTVFLKTLNIIDYKTLALLDLKVTNKKKYDIIILKDNKYFARINNIDAFTDYLLPGNYTIQIYENSLYMNFNPFNLNPAPKKLYEKEIILKANWEEVLNIPIN